MFENLNKKLSNIFNQITSSGILKEEDIIKVMREVRIALLEADVSLAVAKDFINKVKKRAIGQEVIASIKPGHMVIKIVQDELTELLGSQHQEFKLKGIRPEFVMMVGLQGSGKTTTTAKLAHLLKKQDRKILLASLDVYRPAAIEQLNILAKQIGVDSINIQDEKDPFKILAHTITQAKDKKYDVVFLDTAGRMQIDQKLMQELIEIKNSAKPSEILLVADAMTGQEAVNIATEFNNKLTLTGTILTRIDGDSRGGAALSMKYTTNCPIKFLANGEKIDDIELFYPDRIASRILGKGDIVSLVEKATAIVKQDEAEEMMAKIKSQNFNFDDMLKQLRSIKKIGGITSILGMVPGMGQLKEKLNNTDITKDSFTKQEAIILSMTKKERCFPKLINASRKERIANGSGTKIQDINILLKQFKRMQKMMKKMANMDQTKLMRGGISSIKNLLG